MKLDKLNAWLTLSANIGVVLGLIFLGIEIQQSRLATEAATYQARQYELNEYNQNFAVSEILPPIYEKLRQQGLEGLSNVEASRVRAWERARINRMRSQLYQYELGFLDEDIRFNVLQAVADLTPLWEQLGISANSDLIGTISE